MKRVEAGNSSEERTLRFAIDNLYIISRLSQGTVGLTISVGGEPVIEISSETMELLKGRDRNNQGILPKSPILPPTDRIPTSEQRDKPPFV